MLAEDFRLSGLPTLHYTYWAEKGYDYYRRNIYGVQRSLYAALNEGLKRELSLAEVFPFEAENLRTEVDKFEFDVVHFHDISSAISVKTIEKLAKLVPTVWTLHDCSPFTGGCLYPMDCKRYILPKHCGKCPQLGRWPVDTKWDTTWINHKMKTRAHSSGEIHIVSPSRWMARQAEGSGMLRRPVQIIPNGIDTKFFFPRSRDIVRQRLDIPDHHNVLTTISGHLADERKNVQAVIDVLTKLNRADVTLLLIGNINPEILEKTKGFNVVFSGYVHTADKMAEVLSAADAYVFTSLAENHPLSVLEAMSCGLPILGFQTGGVSEQVESGATGLLCPTGDNAALLACVKEALASGKLSDWGKAGRATVERDFTRTRMADDYRRLFESLIEAADRKFA
ncbi:Glycosyltransferase involved in cell wall bisynthesis [Xaviernesmea oryzae]|nr:Glycosyltransferase involved in cell wall bisynthesis [Xaviernesmea oryzae]